MCTANRTHREDEHKSEYVKAVSHSLSRKITPGSAIPILIVPGWPSRDIARVHCGFDIGKCREVKPPAVGDYLLLSLGSETKTIVLRQNRLQSKADSHQIISGLFEDG